MKILGFLLILIGGALLVMHHFFQTDAVAILDWLKNTISITEANRNIIGISVAGAGVLLMLIGFLAGGRRDEI